MNDHENITNINQYRDKKSSEHDSYEESKILDTLNSDHPAGKQWAKEKLLERPDTMAKYIANQLEKNGYPEDVIGGVAELLEQLKAEDKYRPNELAEGLYMEYAALIKVTNAENERLSAEQSEQNKSAKAARATFKIIRDQGQDN